MKHLKLFPKFFFYILGMMLLFAILIHSFLYLLAPRMQLDFTPVYQTEEHLVVRIARERIITEAVEKALPISLGCSLLLSVLCSFFLSRGISNPIKRISSATQRMRKLDPSAVCAVRTEDEIGILANNINDLYADLLIMIASLEDEKNHVRELEQSKIEFLRAASHELKTPVTALNATLENMMLGIGKYKNHEAYLPECKEMVEQLAAMIHDILETTRRNMSLQKEEAAVIDLIKLMETVCEPYRLIAEAKQLSFSWRLPDTYTALLPEKAFRKAVSNILSNAVAYTEPGKAVSIYMDKDALIIENECIPVKEESIPYLFQPFYRTDVSRSRDSGGNGLGLYIVDTIFKLFQIPYEHSVMKQPKGMRFIIHLHTVSR